MRRHNWTRSVIATVSSASAILAFGAATAAAQPQTPEPDASETTEQLPAHDDSEDPLTDSEDEQATGVRAVDWLNATLTVPALNGCPEEETVTFEDGKAEAGNQVYRFAFDGVVKYADVNGDGRDDALVLIDCGPRDSHYTGALVAFTEDADSSAGDDAMVLSPLGAVVNPGTWTQRPIDFMTWHGDIAVAMLDHDLPENAEAAGQIWTEYYRWSGDSETFERIDD